MGDKPPRQGLSNLREASENLDVRGNQRRDKIAQIYRLKQPLLLFLTGNEVRV